jgi:ABC-type antimicrobial peptide transport system permease subunit
VIFSFVILIAASHVAWSALTEALRSTGINTENKWSLTLNYSNIKNLKERKNIHRTLISSLKTLSSIKYLSSLSQPRVPNSLNTNGIKDMNNNYLLSARNTRIASDYLSELGLSLFGENFKPGDSELKNYPIIVNQRFANVLSKDPKKVLGRKVKTWDKSIHKIIGIVPNTYYAGKINFERPEIFNPKQYDGYRRYSFLFTASDNKQLEKSVRDLIKKLDKRLDVLKLVTLDQQFNEYRQSNFTAAGLAISLAVISLLMVIIGVNGIVNYLVQVRRYDLGVKLSMGANNKHLLKESLLELMLPIAMSLLLAFSACFLALGYSRSQPDLNLDVNWLIVGAVLLGFICLSFLASYFPIRKVLNADPIKSLRNE